MKGKLLGAVTSFGVLMSLGLCGALRAEPRVTGVVVVAARCFLNGFMGVRTGVLLTLSLLVFLSIWSGNIELCNSSLPVMWPWNWLYVVSVMLLLGDSDSLFLCPPLEDLFVFWTMIFGSFPLLLTLDAVTAGCLFLSPFLFLRFNDELGDGLNNLRFDSPSVGPLWMLKWDIPGVRLELFKGDFLIDLSFASFLADFIVSFKLLILSQVFAKWLSNELP